MALETEIKLRVLDHDAVRRGLRAAGATFRKNELETNTFLDTASNDLRKSGCGLRVRKAVDERTGQSRCVITHKGPRKPGPMKIREETELEASAYDEAVQLLDQLGLKVMLSFEKRRETWDMGECEVVLDELPGEMGRFVEIEGPDEHEVTLVRERLGLSTAVVEPEGYAVLVAAFLQESGRTTLKFAPR